MLDALDMVFYLIQHPVNVCYIMKSLQIAVILYRLPAHIILEKMDHVIGIIIRIHVK